MDATEPRLTLLVVDDEPLLLSALKRNLGRTFAIVTAQDGEAALAAVREGAHFDAVICDVHMPGMSGPDFRRALGLRAPSLAKHFIWMTGDAAITQGPLHDERILRKPFAPQDMAAAIEKVTQEADGAPELPAPEAPAAVHEGCIQNHPRFAQFMQSAHNPDSVILHLTVPLERSADIAAEIDRAHGELRGQAFRAKADVLKTTMMAAWRWSDAGKSRRVLHVLGVGQKWTPSN